MKRIPPPRIYCIVAARAPLAAVLRRGPAEWSHVGRWDLDRPAYEPGAWLAGRLFPRRCDLSPDGRLLSYFAHKPSATWEHGDAYVAISRLPWLTALHAFGTCGTWTRGYEFTDNVRDSAEGDAGLPIEFGLRPIPAVQFAVERNRGWQEAPDSPPRDAGDSWDERRNARLLKPQPGGHRRLRVESLGWAGGEFGVAQAVDGLRVQYSLETDSDLDLLPDLQWADWDAQGRLLVATRSGKLQIRVLQAHHHDVVFEQDLCRLAPDPVPAPGWAAHW